MFGCLFGHTWKTFIKKNETKNMVNLTTGVSFTKDVVYKIEVCEKCSKKRGLIIDRDGTEEVDIDYIQMQLEE